MGRLEAESRFQKLLTCLSHPPSYTCVRASTHLAPLEEIRQKLAEELRKVQSFGDVLFVITGIPDQCSQRDGDDRVVVVLKQQQMFNSSAEESSMQILSHPQIPDVLLLPVDGPKYERNATLECVYNIF